MLIHTHILLADKLLYNIKGIGEWAGINRLAFYWGNIRPDFHSPFNCGTHMYEKRIDEIERIWHCAEKLSRFNGILCSYYLGYVMHFVADFFTCVHNDEESMSNLLPHFAYEVALHQKMFYASSTDLHNSFNGNFRKYIETLREDYLSGEHSPQRDCAFIYSSTLALAQWAITPMIVDNRVFA